MKRRNLPLTTFFGQPWPDGITPSQETRNFASTSCAVLSLHAPSVPLNTMKRPSAMSRFGHFTRFACPLLVALLVAFVSTSGSLPDGTNTWSHFSSAAILTVVIAISGGIEGLRTVGQLDSERFGRVTAIAVVTNAFIAWAVFVFGAAFFVHLNYRAQTEYAQKKQLKLEESLAVEQERERQVKMAEYQCDAQKLKEVEVLVRRRNAGLSEYRNCIAGWIKPSLLSTETPEQACAPKFATHVQLAAAVKDRQSRNCASSVATGSIGKK